VDQEPGDGVMYSMDQWPGYEADRRRVLKHFAEKQIRNPVVLTGDIHSNWANELIADFDQLDSRVVATEFVGTSLTSGGDGAAHPNRLATVLTENPFVKFHNGQRGYVRCEVSPQSWQADYRVVDRVTQPGAPVSTCKSFVVESGSPRLNAT